MNRQDHLCVLLVENNDQDARVIEDLLAGRDHIEYVVTRAYDATEAHRRLDNGTFDAVLIARDLGDRTGFDLVNELDRTDPFAPPLIMLTHEEDRTLELEAREAGFEDCLAMSEVDAATMERAIDSALYSKARYQRLELLAIYD